MPYLDDLKQVFQNGKEIDRIYTGGSLIWKSNVEYERYNSLLEYTWRQYDTTLQYTWRQYNVTSRYESHQVATLAKSSRAGARSYLTEGGTYKIRSPWSYTSGIRNHPSNSTTSITYDTVVEGGVTYRTGKYIHNYWDNETTVLENRLVYSQGSYRGDVTSTSSTAYPTNGRSGSYWYDTRTSDRVKGSYRGDVTSTSSSAYPTNGLSGSYWYDTRTSEYIKGSYIDIVEAEEGALPNGGRHTDGYWYVLKG